jgi:hypothetical protein
MARCFGSGFRPAGCAARGGGAEVAAAGLVRSSWSRQLGAVSPFRGDLPPSLRPMPGREGSADSGSRFRAGISSRLGCSSGRAVPVPCWAGEIRAPVTSSLLPVGTSP